MNPEEEEFYYEEEDVGEITYSTEAPPKVIQDRIKKRKPNPQCYLSSKKYNAIRFGQTMDRTVTMTRDGKTAPIAKWHEYDSKANKNGDRQLIVLDDGTEYIGQWQQNLRHGTGKHYTSEGMYDGDFVDDLYDGHGQYYLWSDVSNCEDQGKWILYDGDWLEGKMHGNGIQYLLNGDTYEGEFYKGKKCGHGRMYYQNGDEYDGEWKDDMRDGVGTFTKSNGDIFEGTYKKDKKNGEGELHIAENHRCFQGFWVDDMMKYGTYFDEVENPVYATPDDISGTTDGMIPVLGVSNPDDILQQQAAAIQAMIAGMSGTSSAPSESK